jgi:POT family proton-dependent oligopeptide transporter
MTAPAAPPAEQRSKFPPGVPYIVGNEAAERFSYYGMRSILAVYLASLYRGFLPEAEVAAGLVESAKTEATKVTHLFYGAVYAFPMVGAILADRLFGKYRVILWVSLFYCAGHALLAVAGRAGALGSLTVCEWSVYGGLALVALGAGGIKPCVSANVGDQFTAANARLVPAIYQIFYFSINFGSFFATLLIPFLYKRYGAEVAFAVPGFLMAIATFIFWLGRDRFVKVPPKPGGRLGAIDSLASIFLFATFAPFLFGPEGYYLAKSAIAVASFMLWCFLFISRQNLKADDGFLSVLFYAIANQRRRREGMGFFDVAREKFGDEAAEGPPAVLKIMVVFSMVSVFWALFDQHSTTWVFQADQMDLEIPLPWGTLRLTAAQIQALNPLLVMLIIPGLSYLVLRPLAKRGVTITPLQKMTAGMFITALSFVAAALLQAAIDSRAASEGKIDVEWQAIQYVLVTVGEVLVSITGLEFAYTQAPRRMKSTIMGFWLLCVTLGNVLVALLAPLQELSMTRFFWTFAGLMAAAAALFAVLAYFYKGKTYLQER